MPQLAWLAYVRSGFLAAAVCTSLAWASLAPAGEVIPTFDAGILTLTGTADNDRLIVFGTADTLVVMAIPGTQLQSESRFLGRRMQTFENVTALVFVGQGGNDSLQVRADVDSLSYTGGDQVDTLIANLGTATLVTVNTANGDDRVVLTVPIVSMLSLQLGDGANTASISDSRIGHLEIVGGSGPDQILLNRVSDFPLIGMVLSANLGAGDDLLGFQECTIISPDEMMPGMLDGGDDNDQVGQIDSVFTPLPMISNFETVIGFDPPPPPPEMRRDNTRLRRGR